MTTRTSQQDSRSLGETATLRHLVTQLDPTLRRRVADGWLAAARAEHASVASFNRFSMQLLAVGAPATLLEAAQQAALDEVRHTRLCFGIASVYAGEALGPGPLPLGEELYNGFELSALVCGTVEEGCIGETLAALEAGAARDLTEPPAIREVLEVIERDESSHAALAFQTVRWALGQGSNLRASVRRSYLDTLERHVSAERCSYPGEEQLGRHGLLPAAVRQRLRKKAVEEVLRPALAELLS